MRPTHAFALIVLAAAPLAAGTAIAGESLNLTPPLYREQARAVQQTRQMRDMTTTPQPVAASKFVEMRRPVEIAVVAASAP